MNHELKLLVQWLRSCNLSLSEGKSEVIFFGSPRKQHPPEPDIRNDNCKPKLHQFVKYLGVFIDKVLSFNKQIDNICSNLSRANGIIFNLCHFLLTKLCISVYYSIFCSHLLLLIGNQYWPNYKNTALEFFVFSISVTTLMVCFFFI